MNELQGLSETIKGTKEALPDTVNQTDGVLSTVVGFFNNVVLYPVKRANISFKYKLEDFEKDLQEKTSQIPVEALQEPPLMIAGPTLEALRYTYDEYELREMYENLLASAMDSRENGNVHPSFVDIIKQMSPFDAIILKSICEKRQLMCADIDFIIKGTTNVYALGMPANFVPELLVFGDPFHISISLDNLVRLKLIDISVLTIQGKDYNSMKDNEYVKERKKYFENLDGKEIDVQVGSRTLCITNFGESFAKICLSK